MLTALHLTDGDGRKIRLFSSIPFRALTTVPNTAYVVYTRDVHVFNDRSIYFMYKSYMYNVLL